MSEYIKKDDVIKIVSDMRGLCRQDVLQGTIKSIEALENQKEGRWKKISPAGIYECTCCGQNVMTSDIECYKFCHGCGARMEEIKQ